MQQSDEIVNPINNNDNPAGFKLSGSQQQEANIAPNPDFQDTRTGPNSESSCRKSTPIDRVEHSQESKFEAQTSQRENVIAPRSRPNVPLKPNLRVPNQNVASELSVQEATNVTHNQQLKQVQTKQSTCERQLHYDNQIESKSQHDAQVAEAPKRANVKSLISRFSVA